jgi:hypothetical protein
MFLQGKDAYKQRKFAEAERCFRAALSEPLCEFNRNEQYARIAIWLGVCNADHGTARDSESLYVEAIRIRRLIYGRVSEPTASALECLASLYKDQGRFEEADTTSAGSISYSGNALRSRFTDDARVA